MQWSFTELLSGIRHCSIYLFYIGYWDTSPVLIIHNLISRTGKQIVGYITEELEFCTKIGISTKYSLNYSDNGVMKISSHGLFLRILFSEKEWQVWVADNSCTCSLWCPVFFFLTLVTFPLCNATLSQMYMIIWLQYLTFCHSWWPLGRRSSIDGSRPLPSLLYLYHSPAAFYMECPFCVPAPLIQALQVPLI